MQPQTQMFTMAEKLALVNAIESVIHADELVHEGELTILGQLMQRIDFDSNFIIQARNIEPQQGLSILRTMTDYKKKALADILKEVAISDGFVHKKETALMSRIFSSIDIGKESK
ncbi:MAG: hypothetical protein ACR2MT_17310 [Aurantibacter sp.]